MVKASIIINIQSIPRWSTSLLIFILFITNHLSSQDTIRPVITIPPRDTSFECGTVVDIIDKLTEWYNNAGGAKATDNSGAVIWKQNLTLQQSITIFNNSLDIICGNKQKVDVIFTPEDSTGNKGIPMMASFFTTDRQGPRITNTVPNLTYNCVRGVRDTLIAWIKNKGGYVASDLCSNSITWKNFNFSISSSNTVILTGGGSIDNGPYPQLPDGICNWTMNISWIAVDECGNESATPGTTTFTLNDNVPPLFVNPPADIAAVCNNIPRAVNIVVSDDCDRSVTATFQETSTKSADSTSCNYFSYTISRTWTSKDKCGNTASYTQNILVKDTIAPKVTSPADITIGCEEFGKSRDSIFITYMDDCSGVKVSFKDNVTSTGCTTRLERTYTLSDTCKNNSEFKQNINIVNNAKPVILVAAKNESVACTDEKNIEGLLAEWIKKMGGSSAKESCSPLKSFAALKGSYNINNPTTYPGQLPVSIPRQQCPSAQNQFIRFVEVDFVYYDTCGNAAITTGVFGVDDMIKPIIESCPQPITISVAENICLAEVTLNIPVATDNCVESVTPLVRNTAVTVTGPVGNEVIVPTLIAKLGPFNPTLASPLSDGKFSIKLRNFDIGDVTEFFNVIDEGGNSLGRSPLGKDECSSVEFELTADKDKLFSWIQDGFIELKFVPNVVAGIPSLSINNFCSSSTLEVSVSFEIDISNTVRRFYQINGGPEISLSNETQIKSNFDKGNHNINFIFRDCANNKSECLVPVTVKDDVKPVIKCPDNITTSLSIGQCTDTVPLAVNFSVTENCGGLHLYNKKAPASSDASLLSFLYNENKMKYEARSKEIVFSDVFPVKHINVPVVIEVEFFGDNNEAGEYFDILGPGGVLIGNTILSSTKETCGMSVSRFEINRNLFNSWIQNNQISFLAIPKNDGDGINPCGEISAGQTTDKVSRLSVTLRYSDASFSLSVSGATILTETEIPNGADLYNIILNSGTNNVLIQTKDNSGNNAGCSFIIEVKDNEKPVAKCKNIVIDMHPSGLVPYVIEPDLIDNGSTDNCKIVKKTTIPSSLDCTSAGSDVNVKLIVEDEYGNKDTCTSIIKVKVEEIKPAFSAGLCSSDTLKLFSNVPQASIPGTYSFQWDGPGSIDFFVENPFIASPDESFNGVYILTVKGFNNCTTTASLTVNIKPLIKPELTSNENEVCSGEDIILTSTSYSGGIEYLWYEGIFPTGVLIKKTDLPELILTPTDGVHFYYTIAKGPDCSSNPSSLLKVEVKPIPKPELCSSFISLCDGSDLALCAKGNASFAYSWRGPAGYQGIGLNPDIIKNASANSAGEYRLVVSNGNCISDTITTRVIILEKPPQPTIVSADIFCEGAIFSLVAASSANTEKYEWYKNSSLFTTTQENSLIINNAQSALQGSWTVVASKGNCRSTVSATKFVAIDNSLEVGAINDGPACMGDSVQLQATFVPNASYKWKGPVANIPDVFDPLVPGVPGDYSVVITTPTGCQNNASTTVKLISVPEITALSNDSKACMVSSDQIRFSPSVFPNSDSYTFQWSGPNGYFSSSRNPVITNLSTKDTGIYQLVILNEKCPSNKLETRVQFNIIPSKPQVFSPQVYCIRDTIKIQASNTGIVDGFIWSTPLGKFNTATPSLIIASASTSNSGKYTLETIKSGCNSSASDTLTLIINQPPDISARAIEDNIKTCPGESIRLISASGPPLVNVSWSAASPDLVFSDRNVVSPLVTGFKKGLNTVFLAYNINGCPDFSRDTILISVDSIPLLQDDTYRLPYGEKQLLNVMQNDNNNSQNTIRSVTQPQNGKVDIKNRMIEFSPDLRFLRPVTFSYKVCAEFCDDLCSEAKVSIEFDDNVTCKAPTIFTPNNDGINDQFVIPCLDTGRFPNSKVYIFNEWGTEVFYASPYKNDWEGTYSGSSLPVGTYFYIIDTGDGKKPLNGFLILQR
jgi:gliding motility-associated-like protein